MAMIFRRLTLETAVEEQKELRADFRLEKEEERAVS